MSQTVALLKEEITAGRWTKQLPSERDLCTLLHVGRVTVRSAISQLQREGWVRISHGKRCQIVGRRRARVPATSDRVVVLSPVPLQNIRPFTVFWIDGLREHLAEEGYHLEVHNSRSYYTGKPEQALESLVSRLKATAWVLSQSTAQMQRWFYNRATPCVICGSKYISEAMASVDQDYRAIGRHAMGMFLNRGHRNLAIVSPSPGLAGDHEAEEGFSEGLKKSFLPGMNQFVCHHDGSVDDICVKLDLLLKRSAPPTAFLVSHPNNVLTVMSYLVSRGVRFPKNMALISRDNDLFLESMVPSVARYVLNRSLFARKISNLVVGMVRSGVVDTKDHRMMPEFVHGQTLG